MSWWVLPCGARGRCALAPGLSAQTPAVAAHRRRRRVDGTVSMAAATSIMPPLVPRARCPRVGVALRSAPGWPPSPIFAAPRAPRPTPASAAPTPSSTATPTTPASPSTAMPATRSCRCLPRSTRWAADPQRPADRRPASSGTRSAHRVVAGALGVLFAVNTVTGVWNLIEARNDPAGRTRRNLHALGMLLADAGFLYTASLAGGANGEPGTRRAPGKAR